MRSERAPSKSEVFKRSAEFIKYRCGPRWLAPMSGNDYPALEAFCSAAESWCRGDTHNRALAVQAMQALLSILQPHVRHFALMSIVSVSDWEIAGQVIPRLLPPDDDVTLQNLRTAFGGEYSRLRIGQVPPTPRHGVPVVLTLWSGAAPLDLSTTAGRQALSEVDIQTLRENGWNVLKACEWLGVLQQLAGCHSEDYGQSTGGGTP